MGSSIDGFTQLLHCNSARAWQNLIFKLGNDLGYECVLLAIFPSRHTPLEPEHAFLLSNYPAAWRNKYDADRLWHVDPAVAHCTSKTVPLIWSPELFSARAQRRLYDEACNHGLRFGITLPLHGAKGEWGILSLATDKSPDRQRQKEAQQTLPELSCFRDFILESSPQFATPGEAPARPAAITRRELECLKWSATGKSSWEIGQILRCSEPTVNFHFSNVRRKFNVASRRQAVVKAIQMGLLSME